MTLIPYIGLEALVLIHAAQVQELLKLSEDFEDPRADIGADFIGEFANWRLEIVEELAVLHGRPRGRAHELRLTLISADGAIGFMHFRRATPNGDAMRWFPTEPDGHTVRALLQLFKRGRLVESLTLLGDDWRDLESATNLRDIANPVFKGAALSDVLTQEMGSPRFTSMT